MFMLHMYGAGCPLDFLLSRKNSEVLKLDIDLCKVSNFQSRKTALALGESYKMSKKQIERRERRERRRERGEREGGRERERGERERERRERRRRGERVSAFISSDY